MPLENGVFRGYISVTPREVGYSSDSRIAYARVCSRDHSFNLNNAARRALFGATDAFDMSVDLLFDGEELAVRANGPYKITANSARVNNSWAAIEFVEFADGYYPLQFVEDENKKLVLKLNRSAVKPLREKVSRNRSDNHQNMKTGIGR